MDKNLEQIEIIQKNLQKAKKRQKIIGLIIYLLNWCFDISTLSYISILVHLSFQNPFKSHIIGDLNNYFNDAEESTIIKNTNLDKNKNINCTILRNLGSLSICKEIRDIFIEFKGVKLSKIFDFNLNKIRLFSLLCFCITLLMLIISMVITIIFTKMICDINPYKFVNPIYFYVNCFSLPTFPVINGKVTENNIDFYSKAFNEISWIEILGIALRIINVVRFVCSLILYHYIETSDLDKYDDFLDCKNVKKKFFEKFSDAEKLRRSFYIYLALEITKQGIEKLNQNFGIELEKSNEMNGKVDEDKNISSLYSI